MIIDNEKIPILVVDDEVHFHKVISAIFRSPSYGLDGVAALTFASNGRDGLDKFIEQKPVMVITDAQMPGMCGADFIKSIRTTNQDVPVIVISGNQELLEQAVELGANNAILKPFAIDDLVSIIKKHL